MKILLLKSNEPIIGFLDQGLKKIGQETLLLEAPDFNIQKIEQTIDSFKPDICLTNNFDFINAHPEGPAIEGLLEKKGLPAVSWFFESPEICGGSQFLARWYKNEPPRYFTILTTDTHFVDFYKRFQMRAFYLPMGVNGDLIRYSEFAWKSGDDVSLFFSGGAISGGLSDYLESKELLHFYANWALFDFEQVRAKPLSLDVKQKMLSDLEKLFQNYQSFSMDFRRLRKEWTWKVLSQFEDELGALVWKVMGSRFDVLYSLYQLTMVLRDLVKTLPLEVHGAEDWTHLIHGLSKLPRRLSVDELYGKFSKSYASLCMTKQTFQNFIHERIWMSYLVGGFPIADYRADLDQFFKKGEIATYSDSREIPQIFDFYIKNPDSRSRMIKNAQQMILKEHTYDRRAEQIVEIFKGLL